MNLEKIDRCFKDQAHHSWTEDAELITWTKDVVRFLESVLGSEVSLMQTIALMQILTQYSIELQGGMIINDQKDPNRSVWIADAALIASALCANPDKEATWWKAEFSSIDKGTADYATLLAGMLEQIRRSPQVSTTQKL